MGRGLIIVIVIVVLMVVLGTIYFYPKNPQKKCNNLCLESREYGFQVIDVNSETGARTGLGEEWFPYIDKGSCITYDDASSYFNVSKSYLTGTHVTPCDKDTICVCVLDDGSFRGIG